jgi:hypothetical protein
MCCSSLLAQTRGTISGYVKDPSGAFVPGVEIGMLNEGTGAKRSTASDNTGFYQILGLVSGVYTIEAAPPGFKKFRNTGLVLTVDQNVRADVALEVGQVSDSVEVSARAVIIDTRSSEKSATIDDRRVADLPLSGRNVFSLAGTLPGVLNVSAVDNSDLTDARSGPTMNVNGSRPATVYSRFNGTYFNNPSRNTALNAPPPDAIQEIRIQTSAFAADSGRNSGGNVTIVSKQGTNSFHGALWEFVRNDHLNARSFFQAVKPRVLKNQFGGAAGGRIIRDKVFMFGTFEMVRDRSQSSSTSAQPPSTPELNGDFSYLNGKKQLLNPLDNQPFPNNQIPRSLFDPAAAKILTFVPVVPLPGTKLQALGQNPRNSKLFMLRPDFNLTPKQTLFGHYYYSGNKNLQEGLAYSSDIAGWTGRTLGPITQNAGLNHVYMISPAVLSQLTLGYTRSTSLDVSTVTRIPSELGIAGMPQYTDGGSLQLSVPGRFNLLSGGTVKFVSNDYQIQEHVSVVHNRHTIKFGAEYMRLSFLQSFLGPPNFTFNGQRTGGGVGTRGDPMADFLLGAYQVLAVSNGVRVNDDRSTFTVMFVQDDFKVRPRLTLNIGLRYELPTPWVDKHDHINTVTPDASVHSKKFPNAPAGMLFPGDRPRGLYYADRNNLAPRFGFSWDLFGDGRTAIRGAYGIFYDTLNADVIAQETPPFAGSATNYYNGLLSNPFGSIGMVAPAAYIDPNAFTFTLPINGAFGPIRDHLSTTYVQEWNLTVQREVLRNYAISAAYVGRAGSKLAANVPFNAAPYIPGNDASGKPLSTLANAVQRAPFLPGIYSPAIRALDTPFTSAYHALQIELNRRASGGLLFSGSYTLAKALDSISAVNLSQTIPDPFNFRHNRGRSDFDRRHAVVFSGVWTPPLYRSQQGLAGRVLGGWSLSGITAIQSGSPLTIDSGQDTMLNGTGNNSRADIVGAPERSPSSRADMVAQFFNTAAFAQPKPGSPGTSGRGIFSGPALVNTDLAALKDIKVFEGHRFQLRTELFNCFNQVNFNNPVTGLTNSQFGKINGARSGRTIQLGLKYLW